MHKFFHSFIRYSILLISASTWAVEVPVTPQRLPNEPWELALEKQFEKIESLGIEKEIEDSFYDFETFTVNGLPQWKGTLSELHQLNQQTYLVRRYENPNPGRFQRRAAWLFPVDGCYAKAAHVSSEAAKRGFSKPGKVFAYGNLQFSTRYARNGKKVYWSYHVAAGYMVGSTVYVLDPMVNSEVALTLAEWLAQISTKPSLIQVKLCDANAYSPYSKCRGSKGNGAYLGHMTSVLKQEWSHLVQLGFSPSELLGPKEQIH